MFLFPMLLGAVAAPATPEFDIPDFIVHVNNVEVPIQCKQNEQMIRELETLQTQTFLGASSLRVLRKKGTLTEEQNNQLFSMELVASGIDQVIAAHRFAEFFCSHPDKLPKAELTMGT